MGTDAPRLISSKTRIFLAARNNSRSQPAAVSTAIYIVAIELSHLFEIYLVCVIFWRERIFLYINRQIAHSSSLSAETVGLKNAIEQSIIKSNVGQSNTKT